MSKVLIEEQTLHDIGHAIREKAGESTTYKPGEMAEKISAINQLFNVPDEYQKVEYIQFSASERSNCIITYIPVSGDVFRLRAEQSSYADRNNILGIHRITNFTVVSSNKQQRVAFGFDENKQRLFSSIDAAYGDNDTTNLSQGSPILYGNLVDGNAFDASFMLTTNFIQGLLYAKSDTPIYELPGQPTYTMDRLIDDVNYKIVLGSYMAYSGQSIDMFMSGKIYSLSVTRDNGAVHLLLTPCYRKSDGAPGFYDAVNGVFYNAYSGTFIAGPDVV